MKFCSYAYAPPPPTFDKILAEKTAFYKRDLTVLDHVANKYIMTNTDWLAEILLDNSFSSTKSQAMKH